MKTKLSEMVIEAICDADLRSTSAGIARLASEITVADCMKAMAEE